MTPHTEDPRRPVPIRDADVMTVLRKSANAMVLYCFARVSHESETWLSPRSISPIGRTHIQMPSLSENGGCSPRAMHARAPSQSRPQLPSKDEVASLHRLLASASPFA